jgi:hypothetical protein
MPVMTKTPKGDEIVILARKEYDQLIAAAGEDAADAETDGLKPRSPSKPGSRKASFRRSRPGARAATLKRCASSPTC